MYTHINQTGNIISLRDTNGKILLIVSRGGSKTETVKEENKDY